MRILSFFFLLSVVLWSCGDGGEKAKSTENTDAKPAPKTEAASEPASDVDLSNKGIGPVSAVTLGELDQGKVDEGKQLFSTYCVACHQAEKDFIGPSPKDILERRSPEWVMNMILNPGEMIAQDPIAKQLLKEANGVPMVGQGLTEDQARSLLEYFRTL